MFVIIDCADTTRESVRVPIDTIAEYRPWKPGEKHAESKHDIKSIIIFRKCEGKQDLYSRNTCEQLDKAINPVKLQ